MYFLVRRRSITIAALFVGQHTLSTSERRHNYITRTVLLIRNCKYARYLNIQIFTARYSIGGAAFICKPQKDKAVPK
jgi:hypothetical protein